MRLINIILNEYRTVFRDEGVVLIMLLAPIIYATIYSLTYGTEVLRNIPIGVVDISLTPSSRQLIDEMNSTPNIVVAYETGDMHEAKQLLFDRKIYGIAYIPSDYEKGLMREESTSIAIYLDASYMLAYRQVFQALTTTIFATDAIVEFEQLLSHDTSSAQAQAMVQPIRYEAYSLFNPSLGYGTFVMPPALILILQQTLLIGIGMIGGTRRRQTIAQTSTLKTILGRSVTYFSLYAIICLYLFMVHYRLCGYPINGRAGEIAIFIGLYLLASIFAAIALSTLFRSRETPLLLLLLISIPLLMISGISFPAEAMPVWVQAIAKIFPSTFGIQGFVRLQTMGASLNDVLTEVESLAILTVIYFTAAYIAIERQSSNKT